jgi:excisionase family DNA binding protein
MNVEEVADRLGVNVRYVRRLVAERRMRYVKVGHLIRFDPDDVDAWVESSSVGPVGSDRERFAAAGHRGPVVAPMRLPRR